MAVLAVVILATLFAVTSETARSTAAAPNCHAVKFVGVRGSGDTAVPFGIIAAQVSGGLVAKAHAAGVDYGTYGLPYTAVGIAFKSTMPIAYWLSERQGRNMLRAYIREQVADCPNEKLLVEGYSQGAQVVGDVFSKGVGGLDANALNHVAGVALLADPRFNSRESFDHGTFRTGRNGILGARSPGDLSSVSGKIAAWCRKDDLVCQGPGSTANHDQSHYWDDYGQAVVAFLAARSEMSPSNTVGTTALGTTAIATAPTLVPGHTYQVDLRGQPTAELAAPGETQDGGLCPMWAGLWWRLNLKAGDHVSISWRVSPPADGFYQYLVFSPNTTDKNVVSRANNGQQLQFVHSDSGAGSGSFVAPASGLYPFIVGDGCPSTSGPFHFVVTVSRSATTTTTTTASGWPTHRNDGPPALYIWLGASFIAPSWASCTKVYCIVGDDADQQVLIFKIQGGLDELGPIAENQNPHTALANAGFSQTDINALLAPTG